jgi:hypothetical protein
VAANLTGQGAIPTNGAKMDTYPSAQKLALEQAAQNRSVADYAEVPSQRSWQAGSGAGASCTPPPASKLAIRRPRKRHPWGRRRRCIERPRTRRAWSLGRILETNTSVFVIAANGRPLGQQRFTLLEWSAPRGGVGTGEQARRTVLARKRAGILWPRSRRPSIRPPPSSSACAPSFCATTKS